MKSWPRPTQPCQAWPALLQSSQSPPPLPPAPSPGLETPAITYYTSHVVHIVKCRMYWIHTLSRCAGFYNSSDLKISLPLTRVIPQASPQASWSILSSIIKEASKLIAHHHHQAQSIITTLKLHLGGFLPICRCNDRCGCDTRKTQKCKMQKSCDCFPRQAISRVQGGIIWSFGNHVEQQEMFSGAGLP